MTYMAHGITPDLLCLPILRGKPNQLNMKKFLLTAAVAILSGGLMAQDNQLSFGVDLALPMGDFGDAYSLGVGPTVGFELPVGDALGVTVQVGYDILMVKSDVSDFIKSAS